MPEYILQKTCHHCNGSGIVPVYTIPDDPPSSSIECPECGGDGVREFEYVDLTLIEDLIQTVDSNAVLARDEAATAKVVASGTETKVGILLERLTDIEDKVNDIKEKCDEIHDIVKVL